ncbi:MAG: FtsX-like permease family protein [Spirochaetia bacterium]
MKLRKIAWRNIRRNTRRSILSMSAVAIAAMTFVFMFSLIEGMKQDVAYNLQTFVTGEVRIHHSEFEKYKHLNPLHLGVDSYTKLTARLDSMDGVRTISPRIKFPTAIYKEGNTYRAQGQGVDFEREAEYQGLEEYVVKGRMPRNGRNEVLVATGLAKEMNLDIGDNFTLLTQTRGRGMNAITFEITGLSHYNFGGLNNSFFQAPLDRVQYFLRMDNSVSEILIKLDDNHSAEEFAAGLDRSLTDWGRPQLEARMWKNISQTYSFVVMADTVYFIIALMFFLLGSTVIINTMMMTIFERRKEIGTINAMGMTGPEIVRLFFLEAFYIAAIGSFVGVLAGIGITYPLSIYGLNFSAAMEGVDMEVSQILRPVLNLKSTLFVFLYSTFIASVASFIPSRKSAKIEPIEALRAI